MSTLSVRRPLSVLAVLAMVATLLFAVAGTASAATPASGADFAACPANADIPDPGFTDTTTSFAKDDIDCIAYYAVTKGTTPTTYDPAAPVTRWQMALFLTRMAGPSGVALDSTPPSAGFTDIGDLGPETQDAINALADAGIVKGTTATTYSPDNVVTRQQMALFLTRFLGDAVVGPGGTKLADAAKTGAPFTDIGSATFEAYTAINQVWDLKVTTGKTATTYVPLGNVTREQMAAFMARLMGHTNARPMGVNIQAKPVTGFGAFAADFSVTARNADFSPAVNAPVDIWRFDPTLTVTSPFNTDGTCNIASGTIAILQGGGTACTIELIDPTMDLNGNWPVFTENATDGAVASFYAWTGANGAKFDNDTTVYSMVSLGSSKAALDYTLKTDLPKNSICGCAKFGTTVTYTVQLVDTTPPSTLSKPVAKSGVAFTFMDVKSVNGAAAGTTYTTVKTDATGKATYQVTQTDPNAILVAPYDFGTNAVTVTGAYPNSPESASVNWNDDAAVARTVIAATATDYKVQADAATNSATGTVYDQYGLTMSGVVVDFIDLSDQAADAEGIGAVPISRTTNASGVATLGYTWNHVAPALDVTGDEHIQASIAGDSDTTHFFWVNTAATAAIATVTFKAEDVANDKFVALIAAGTYLVYGYDSGDWYVSGTPTTMAKFETALADTVTPPVGISVTYNAPGISIFGF